MNVMQRLDIQQSQSLVLTPQLQQAIKMLQLSNLELGAFIRQEIECNPVLEQIEPESIDLEQAGDPDSVVPEPDESLVCDSVSYLQDGLHDPDGHNRIDTDLSNLYDQDYAGAGANHEVASFDGLNQTGMRASGTNCHDHGFDWTANIADRTSLRDHLIEQIQLDFHEPHERALAQLLLDYLSPAGWFTGDLDQISTQLACERRLLERILAGLQQMDPPGIFARGTAECLRIQLVLKGELDDTIATLLDHLDLIGEGKLGALIQKCKTDRPGLIAMVRRLRVLHPKPAETFRHGDIQAIIPDVLVTKRPDGQWHLELNDAASPKIDINRQFSRKLDLYKGFGGSGGSGGFGQERRYLATQYQNARWLQKSLRMRALTILKVTNAIIRRQDGFFRYGITCLRPLVLREIADAVGLHES
ncbi:MAG: RNA polymerase sigma-54 factor, partial [Pseudomonadota bacterium]